MKTIISILVGITVFFLCFLGMNSLINWLTSGIHSDDIRGVMRLVAWIFSIGFTLFAGIFLGYMAGIGIDIIWPDTKNWNLKEKYKKYKKL